LKVHGRLRLFSIDSLREGEFLEPSPVLWLLGFEGGDAKEGVKTARRLNLIQLQPTLGWLPID
jgi:hypothetical protein